MRKYAVIIFILFFVSACSIVGVHFKLHNPNRAGKYPEPTEALTLLGDQDSKYRSNYDVTYYKLHVEFGKDLNKDKGIRGVAEMRAIALSDLDTVQIDAAENLNITSVLGVSFNGQATTGISCESTPVALKYVRSKGALFVIFNSRVKKSEVLSIIISYTGVPPDADRAPWKGGFVRKKDEAGNHWWGVACQSEGASSWWPCKDVVNDEPMSCDLEFEVPPGYTAVSNGRFVHESIISDSSAKRFNWHVSYPINLYNITFYVGKFREIKDEYKSKVSGQTIALNHFVLEPNYEKAKAHFAQLKDHLAVYEKYFGAYPFADDGFKLVESPYAGMEHQTAIAYGNKFKNNYLGFDYIILHETAHEWWGNSLTAYDLADGWLHEGFATYSEAIYVEEKYGRQQYLDYMKIYRWSIINRRPLVGPYGIRYFNYKDGDIYTKGAWVLHTLRETIANDSVFFDIIKTFATRYRLKNVRSQDFINVVNEKTKSDYSWFFAQYLNNRFIPVLEYYQKDGVFYYAWNSDYTNEHFPLSVAIKGIHQTGNDTLIPLSRVSTLALTGNQTPELMSNVLVIFKENKKLRKRYQKLRASKTGK
jgi:aminopeptidase N